VVGVASNSRGILILGAVVMIAATAAISANSGTGWVIPMTILLSIIFVILSFSMLTSRNDADRGSTPLSIKTEIHNENIESGTENLPDPLDAGIELPIL
tara:strand:+ start:1073 stop:1369 length:297 start_codon:yes stop_codon:yes gene_type:complete